ncbi:MarR family winged helix-turn-helix transcriptional regulator [Arthrobacter sp. Z1-15]
MEETLDDLERSLAAVLRLLADRTTYGEIAQRCGYSLPPASWALLEYLDAYGELRVSDIAACHGVDVSSITPRLKRLENEDLIRRERIPTDARAFLISITGEGAQALQSIHSARRGILSQALNGADSVTLSNAADVLRSIAVHLSSDSARPVHL